MVFLSPRRTSPVSPCLPRMSAAGGHDPGFFFMPLRLAEIRTLLTRTSDVCGNSTGSPPMAAEVGPVGVQWAAEVQKRRMA